MCRNVTADPFKGKAATPTRGTVSEWCDSPRIVLKDMLQERTHSLLDVILWAPRRTTHKADVATVSVEFRLEKGISLNDLPDLVEDCFR